MATPEENILAAIKEVGEKIAELKPKESEKPEHEEIRGEITCPHCQETMPICKECGQLIEEEDEEDE